MKRGGGSNRSLELKLNDFTLGFRALCADLAGSCEEVTVAGSWIGTGAGAVGKLNKYGEAGGAAEGKYGAGEAAAVQANFIWLISGAIVTLNFLKMSMPSMGLATAACKKLDGKVCLEIAQFFG